jgi:hypothetical protein
MGRVAMACALGGALVSGAAQAQAIVPDQPISNLREGISPQVEAVRRQHDQTQAAADRLNQSDQQRVIAIRLRLAEHDCSGARSLASQANDLSLSAQVETLCAPPAPTSSVSHQPKFTP